MEFPIEAKEMREIYCETLIELAAADDRIVLVEADLMRADGLMPFRDKYPERVFDVGVAESNMMGVAAGLATCGKTPFATTFGAFATRRGCDQITVSIAYPRLNVKIAGIDPGVSTEVNGATHMALEDVSIMRAIPNMLVVEPVDSEQLRQALPRVAAHDGPCYIRLFRKKAPKVFDSSYRFTLGKADVLREGSDVVLFASGLMVSKALLAAELLANDGVRASVVNPHTIKPLDVECVVRMAKRCGAVVTAENHTIQGGLGGAICEELAGVCPVPVVRVGVKDRFGEVGTMNELFALCGMDVPDIAAAAKKAVSLKR